MHTLGAAVGKRAKLSKQVPTVLRPVRTVLSRVDLDFWLPSTASARPEILGTIMRVRLSARFGFAAAASLFADSAPSLAADVALQPAKPWVLDYADAQCAAGRDFGDPQKPVTLIIRPAPEGDTYELQLIRKRPGPASAEEDEGSVDFGLGPRKAWVLHFGSVAAKLDIYQYRITAADMQQAQSASTITLRNAHGPNVSLSLTSMPALLNGLTQCNSDLRVYWNVGKAGFKAATPAKGDLRGIFTGADYPDDAARESKQGTAQFLLFIDAAGKVAGCHVLIPSGVPLLDAMGCQVIRQRAKFTPARDASGKPVRGSVVTPRVSWRLGT